MFWIIGSLASILFVIFFMCMLIAGRRADQISRNDFAEFFITNGVGERGTKGGVYEDQGGRHVQQIFGWGGFCS